MKLPLLVSIFSSFSALTLIDTAIPSEMDPGSALVFLASSYHGGGTNSTTDEWRKVHGLFFVRGTLRQEENQFLAVPRSQVLGMNDELLSLLGYKKPTTVLGTVNGGDPAADLRGCFERCDQ